jgi:hypothetical protein
MDFGPLCSSIGKCPYGLKDVGLGEKGGETLEVEATR